MANDAGGSRNGVDKRSPSDPKDVENAEYKYDPPIPLIDTREFKDWSFYRAIMTEFVATLLYLYVTVATVIGHVHASERNPYGGVGTMGIAWSFGGMFFVLVYCTTGLSGGHINPAITFGRFVGRKVTLNRAAIYMVAQCAGAICGAGIVKSLQKTFYSTGGGGANSVAPGYTKITALVAEIIGTFVLVYTVFIAKDHNRKILGPLAIGFAVFVVILATIPITGAGINPARSFGAAVIYNHKHSWDDQCIFWLGPLIGATLAAGYHEYIKSRSSSSCDLES